MVTTDLDEYDNPVWYVPGGLAIILSLHRVGQSGQDGGFYRVTKQDGKVRDCGASQVPGKRWSVRYRF